jgi:hypothetical protein
MALYPKGNMYLRDGTHKKTGSNYPGFPTQPGSQQQSPNVARSSSHSNLITTIHKSRWTY